MVNLHLSEEEIASLIFILGHYAGGQKVLSEPEKMLIDSVIVQVDERSYTYFHGKQEVLKHIEKVKGVKSDKANDS